MDIRQTLAAATAAVLMLAAAPSVALASDVSIFLDGIPMQAGGIHAVTYDDPAPADVVGGALVAGKVAVPWAVFRMKVDTSSPALHKALSQGVHINAARLVMPTAGGAQQIAITYTLHDVVITSIKAVPGSSPPQEDVRITYASKTAGDAALAH